MHLLEPVASTGTPANIANLSCFLTARAHIGRRQRPPLIWLISDAIPETEKGFEWTHPQSMAKYVHFVYSTERSTS